MGRLLDKTKVDEIIDGLLGNNDLTASPEVWYRLYQIKNLPVMEIITCGECKHSITYNGVKYVCCEIHNTYPNENYFCGDAERRTDGQRTGD